MNNINKIISNPKLLDITLSAGEIALEFQKKLDVKTKEDNSYVSNGDFAVSDFLIKELSKIYTDFEVYSEENFNKDIDTKKVIVIDPIDGTQSYVNNEKDWSVMIAFYENGHVIESLIYQASRKKLYYAKKDKGSYQLSIKEDKTFTSKKLCVKNPKDINKTVVSSKNQYKDAQIWIDKNNIKNEINLYSAGLKAVEVAKGNADSYPCFGKRCSIWDIMPSYLIVKEAGGFLLTEETFEWNFKNPLCDYNLIFTNNSNDKF